MGSHDWGGNYRNKRNGFVLSSYILLWLMKKSWIEFNWIELIWLLVNWLTDWLIWKKKIVSWGGDTQSKRTLHEMLEMHTCVLFVRPPSVECVRGGGGAVSDGFPQGTISTRTAFGFWRMYLSFTICKQINPLVYNDVLWRKFVS